MSLLTRGARERRREPGAEPVPEPVTEPTAPHDPADRHDADQPTGPSLEPPSLRGARPRGSRSGGTRPRRGRAAQPAVADQPAAGTASVNLLSPWVLEGLRVRALRGRFVLAAAVLVLAVAGAWGWLRLDLQRTETALADDLALNAEIFRQVGDLADVRDYVADVAARSTTIGDVMLGETAQSRVLAALDAALPEGAAWQSVQVQLPTATILQADPEAAASQATEALTCPGPDPFGARLVEGCVTITGTAASRDDVSRLVEALGADPLFVEPFVSTTSTDATGDALPAGAEPGLVSFTGSVGLSAATLSGRYDDLTRTGSPTTQNVQTGDDEGEGR